MIWNDHSKLVGQHAILSPSNYHWLNYNEEDLVNRVTSSYSSTIGTILHAFACDFIQYRTRMVKSDKRIMRMELLKHNVPYKIINELDLDGIFENIRCYVNDAIGYKMDPERVLYFSDNCFGTADAIVCSNNMLRIHDLKTGQTPAHMEQLLIYAAIFCHEYKVKPDKIDIELRIYQSNDIIGYIPEADEIKLIMETIVMMDKVVDKLKERDQ